jgi:hypothetical protein
LVKCPKCEKSPIIIDRVPVEVHMRDGKKSQAFAYSCAECGILISIEMESLKLRKEIEASVQNAVRQLKNR